MDTTSELLGISNEHSHLPSPRTCLLAWNHNRVASSRPRTGSSCRTDFFLFRALDIACLPAPLLVARVACSVESGRVAHLLEPSSLFESSRTSVIHSCRRERLPIRQSRLPSSVLMDVSANKPCFHPLYGSGYRLAGGPSVSRFFYCFLKRSFSLALSGLVGLLKETVSRFSSPWHCVRNSEG